MTEGGGSRFQLAATTMPRWALPPLDPNPILPSLCDSSFFSLLDSIWSSRRHPWTTTRTQPCPATSPTHPMHAGSGERRPAMDFEQQQPKVPSPPRLPLPLSHFDLVGWVPSLACCSICLLACCSKSWPSRLARFRLWRPMCHVLQLNKYSAFLIIRLCVTRL